jgi:putative peptidoglycan lipid II flippase
MDAFALNRYLIRNASVTSILRGTAVLTGFVLDALILAYFGIGKETDALFASMAIPLLIFSALDNQAPKVLVPVLTHSFEKDGPEATWDLMRKIITVIGALLLLLSIILAVTAKVLVPLQVPGFQGDVKEQSIRLFTVLAGLTVIQGISPVLQSFLFARHHYVVPSLGRVTTNCVTSIAVIAFHQTLGIYAAAVGFLFGAAAQLIILFVACSLKGLTYRVRWGFGDPRVGSTLRMFVYPLSGHAITESKVFIENFLASMLGGGKLSVLRYATRIIEAVSGVLLGGLITTSLPLVSQHAAAKNLKEMKLSILNAIRIIAFISMPISCWLIFTAQPTLVLLYGRGRFSTADATVIASLIAMMTPYVLFIRISGIVQIPFYANMRTKTPMLAVAVFIGSYVGTVLLLAGRYDIYGFAIASSVASISSVFSMSFLINRSFGPLGWIRLKTFGLKMSLVMAVTVCAFLIARILNEQIISETMLSKWLRLMIPTAFGTIGFAVSSVLFGIIGWRHLRGVLKAEHRYEPAIKTAVQETARA